jgi:hypothetical protein
VKKLVAWPLVQLLYYFGDGVARLMHYVPDDWERAGDFGYWLYSRPMQCSWRLNDWAGLKVWK